jgi:hypothetical protein
MIGKRLNSRVHLSKQRSLIRAAVLSERLKNKTWNRIALCSAAEPADVVDSWTRSHSPQHPRTGGQNRRKLIISSSSRRHLKLFGRATCCAQILANFLCFSCACTSWQRRLNQPTTLLQKNVAVESWELAMGLFVLADLGHNVAVLQKIFCIHN